MVISDWADLLRNVPSNLRMKFAKTLEEKTVKP
jgi:hypothetical protein